MKLSRLAATIVVLSLIACGDPGQPTSETGPESTPIEVPTATGPSPTGASPSPESSENILIETPEYTGVIFSKEGALQFKYRLDQTSTSFWEPSIDDISRAEKCVRQFVASLQDDPELGTYQKDKAAFIWNNLEKYRRQYVGIVVDGEKRIWCNAFLVDYPVPHWKSAPVDAIDGGEYHWNIE